MENFLFSNIKNFRYERKFYVLDLTKDEIEHLLRQHPAAFSEIYYQRFVNNIYFDSFNLRNYYDNVNGESKRLKVRVRWYGDLAGQIDDPILELKFKNNLHIGKLTYPLKGFPLDRDFSIQKMRAIFKESGLPDFIRLQIAELNFSLMNRYRRKYFLSGDGKFRVTVDDNLSVYDMFPFGNSFKNEIRNHFAVIVELKYNNPHEENADFITGYFPFRLTRNSKYVAGLQRLNI